MADLFINEKQEAFSHLEKAVRRANRAVAVATPASYAFAVYTFTGNAADTQTISAAGKTYTLQTVLTDVDGNVLIGATASDTIDNLVAAINLEAGAGSTYATSTTINQYVTAVPGPGDTFQVIAKVPGESYNNLIVSDTIANGAWATTKLIGGSDGCDLDSVVSYTSEALYDVAEVAELTFNVSDQIRIIEIMAAATAATTTYAALDIEILLADGSVHNFHMFNNTRWEWELAGDQPQIVRVRVTNQDVNDTRIILNAISRK